MKLRRAIILSVAVALGTSTAHSADRGTAEEAVALLDKATRHFREVGKEKALSDFTEDKANYVDRDLYLFCFGEADGKWTAHGANKALIGRDLMQVKDANGKAIGAEMMDVVKSKGEGWVDYVWSNPTTKKIEAKSSIMRRFGDQICGVGIYK